MSNKFVGAHCSASGGVYNAVYNAQKIGAKAFALLQKIKKDGKQNP
jgi:deoxyribonuclease-4